MKIRDIITNGSFQVKELSQDSQLTAEIQQRLAELGCLDPPPDGNFGPVSKLSLIQFAKTVGLELGESISADLAQALLDSKADTLLPVELGTDLASRIIKYMQLRNYWFARLPDYHTIVYLEGSNENGSLNDAAPNKFNDRRIVVTIENKRPKILGNWEATSEPGRHYTMNPVNVGGTARIALSQFKAWIVGTHHGLSGHDSHEALVQRADITVYRDLNKDFKRIGDQTDIGSSFGINQHSGHNQAVENIGRASAGCLVGRTDQGHKEFMKIIKTDLRYEANNGYKFMTTVIGGDDLQNKVP
jgi:peptidoglycan hydrolase-like protein with peptidoglycan-binding domain